MLGIPDDPNILVIRGGAIGDFILTLPAIGALRERWPQARIEILGYPRIIALAEGRHYANTVRSIDAAAMSRFFVEDGVLRQKYIDSTERQPKEASQDPAPHEVLSRYFASFDLVVSWLYDPDDVFSNNLMRVGVSRLVRGSVHPENEHAAVHLARPLAELDIVVENPQPRVYPNAEDRAFADEFFRKVAASRRDANPHHDGASRSDAATFVAVHPGSGGERKIWPIDRWAAVVRWLREEQKRDVLLVGGEADEAARRALAPLGMREAWNLPLPQLAAVLEQCSLFLGHDSGISHLAAAVGVPTLALFGPTLPKLWSPLGPRVRVLNANGPMEILSVEAVRQAVAAMI